ncbi:MAG TPA: endonuclease domain-containing protein [Bacillota bacterium]|nr:endonuclease domain-containing protein [Bacillota bacterium]
MNPAEKYKQFIFEDYQFDPATGVLDLHYSMDGDLKFTESYKFDFAFADYNEAELDRALQALFFLAGSSYYKTYIPREIVIKKGALDAEQAAFFSKTYQRGMGEFWYVNKLDPHTPVTFPVTTDKLEPLPEQPARDGMVVAIGGGKDSLVSVETLRERVQNIGTWSLNHRPQLTPMAERIGLPHYWVDREWDTILLELNKQGALNGHIPISGIFACVGTVVAILAGKRDVVVSNENSANDPTLVYEGVEVNHQYSKSQEFEQDFQKYLRHTLGDDVRYYSFLRPYSEIHIAEVFAKIAFEKYKDVFSSCNRAFVHGSTELSWCGVCSKCAFVFLALTPFIPREKLETVWGGKNLLLDPALEPMYRKLLGIEGDKPLDCVGDVKESRSAMRLAQNIYPELQDKYQFDIPEGYDYRKLFSHEMPEDIYAIFQQTLALA